jgi:hypothetical protein
MAISFKSGDSRRDYGLNTTVEPMGGLRGDQASEYVAHPALSEK